MTSAVRTRLAGCLLPLLIPLSIRADEPATLKSVKITILSTMLTDFRGVGEWGFSALVEADGRKILFDTGMRPDTVLKNARELGVDLSEVAELILSHHHGDHTGGLITLREELLKERPNALAKAYVGKGIFLNRPRADGSESNETIGMREPFEKTGGAFVEIAKPTEIFPGAWLTGPVPRRYAERNWSGQTRIKTPEGLVEDTLPEDMALVLSTDRGLVTVCGCGHAGIVNTLEHARRSIRSAPAVAVIGGFHLFDANEPTLDFTAGKLKEFGVKQFLGAHCTGIEPVFVFRDKLGLPRSDCLVGAVGATYDLETGFRPGRIAR